MRVWKTSVQHVRNAWSGGVAARPGILVCESAVVLKGAGVCVLYSSCGADLDIMASHSTGGQGDVVVKGLDGFTNERAQSPA